ncbi:MAG: 2-hydroxycarboxylate transporter family protein, partial [Tolumonas sp.]
MSEINPSSVLENSGQIKESGFFGKLMDIKVGVISLPVYLVLSLIVLMAAKTGNLPNDLIGGFAVVMVLGLILSELGMKLPLLKNIGGPAILALMVPSFLVYWQVLPSGVLDSVTTLMKKANFLYLYISILVCGSMLGMHRQTLINGLARIFIPMIVGTAVAIATGLLVGVSLGYSVHHTIFYIIVPIICGGVGEGILPLSIAYSGILGNEAGTYVAQMIPAAVIGNIVAIIAAGVLKRIADRKPEYNGDGVLVKSSENLANM